MNRLPDAVLRENAAGHFERVATRRLRAGDRVRVLSGEAFPADGTIVRGRTHADEALLTGESTPVLRAEGDTVTAGSYNLDAVVDVRVDGVGADTRFAQIVGLMESASLQKPRMAQRSEEHTSELQSPCNLVCRLLLEKKKKNEHIYVNDSTCDT